MELNSFLTGIADAIRSKKGTTDKINASNFASEIASISGGGSSAHIIKPGELSCTAVPNTGYVENVYFNTNLSVDEVVGLLENLTLNYGGQGEILTASSLNEEGPSQMISVIKLSESFWMISYSTYTDSETLFVSSDDFDLGYVGWNPNITYPIVLGYELQSSLEGEDDEGNVEVVPIGTQNSQLSSLFSTTPFVQASGESIGLSGEYDGSSIEVTEAGKIDIKALIDEKKIPLEVNVNVSGGGSSEETLIVLKYMIETVNMVLDASKVVFNNPDNIPIYKSVMTILDYETGEIAFGDLELYEGELTFWNEGNIIESNTIDEANGSVTYYFIKPKDLIGKQCPYITGITLTIDNENLTTTCAILPNNFSVVEIGGILLIDNSGRSYIYEAGTYNTTNHKIELSNHIMIKS